MMSTLPSQFVFLQPENVLYSRHHEVKLIDFGLATTFTPGQQVSEFFGTLEYMAPEVCELEEYEGPNADIWSLGITLKHLLKGLEVRNGTHSFTTLSKFSLLLYGLLCSEFSFSL